MPDLDPQTFRLAIGQAKTVRITMETPPAGGVASWSMRFRLRKKGGSVVIEKTTASGITTVDSTAGVWDIAILADDTYPADPASRVRPGVYSWAFWEIDAGEENPIAYGTSTVYETAETG